MTFKQLQDQVLDNCQELQDITDFSLTKVKHYINRGYYDFVRQTRCMEKDIEILTAADQEYYTSSDAANPNADELSYLYDIYEARYIDTLSGGNAAEYGDILKPIPHKKLREKWASGTPDYYWVKFNGTPNVQIGTYPTIGSTGHILRLSCFVFPSSELSADGNIPDIKSLWHDALSEYATYRLFKIYSHLKPEYNMRSKMALELYQGYVNDANYNNISDQLDQFDTIQDVYAT